MTIFQAILLGIIQGATEFLPISSSGHLVLVPHLLGWQFPAEQAFLFNVLVQLGTLLAVIVYFRKDLLAIGRAFIQGLLDRKPLSDPQSKLGWYLILATLPAGVFGLLYKDQVEMAFTSPHATAWFLLSTAALLLIAERAGKRSRSLEEISWLDALWSGVFQALALLPGISRSGATITGGMTRNLERAAAARFSFLMAVPVMLAAGVLAMRDLVAIPSLSAFLGPLLAGFVTAALVGYAAIRWLLGYLSRSPLYGFSIYLVMLSAVLLLWNP
ncbi:MAG: undecaprenyl-diphosphatase UppP [Anaerolineae bacterium]|nr:undecaprenyl-diphosphatase UppP [Anaerolineae bacterium]